MAKQTNARQLLETASATLANAPKVSFSAVFVTRETSEEHAESSASETLHVQCDVDRNARRAHLITIESHGGGCVSNEYYYDGDVQYVRVGGAWRRSALSAAAAERIYARGSAFQLVNLESIGTAEVSAANAGRPTLTFRVSASQLQNAVPMAQNAPQQTFGDATVQLQLSPDGRTIDALRVESGAARNSGDDRLTARQSIEVVPRILPPSFKVAIPDHVRATAFTVGADELDLTSPEATAMACLCTGCAACAACLACLACISCVACIFPPLLVPVTATAAGTAVAAAISAATAISTGTATAIQSGQ